MHRCEKVASVVGVLVWLLVSALVTAVACVVFLLPFLLLLVLDALVGDRPETSTITAAPPAPPQQPFAATWSRRVA